MPSEMMSLGDFHFETGTAAYARLRQEAEYHWPGQSRIGGQTALQYVGEGERSMELDGVIYPLHSGGLGQMDALRGLASAGRPLLLTDGRGRVWGRWAIRRVTETQSVFFDNGVPRRIEFRLRISRYGESDKR